ncbi:ATP-binding protein [Streptomyces albidoflavus]|uniref:ATP-binding protein n=1 Tax=unclassified Streptomyces TaxID=2593676 RepID=UPI001E2A8E03|nr:MULTISPECIES: ATP-binding protein [unclassified Streptomyces]MCO6696348.1 ATP-binding protein [Streptomyces sp. Vc17.3-30]
MTTGLSPMNRALNLVPKRAESRQTEQLRDTFVDSGVAIVLESVDHQVLYGRRGTGKTHAFRYLATEVKRNGDIAVYLDLRTVGSPEGLFLGEEVKPIERASRLLVDLLNQFHDALMSEALEDDELIENTYLVAKLDQLLDSISTVRVSGEVEVSKEGEKTETDRSSFAAKLGFKAPELEISGEAGTEKRKLTTETRRGTESISLNFSDIARALRELFNTLHSRRVWLLLDEWSSVPGDIQPHLGEFLVRCLLPLQGLTVKVAAIEQQTNFRAALPSGQMIGLELGADIAANVSLDEFMVFEENRERSRDFFKSLFFNHLIRGGPLNSPIAHIATNPQGIVRHGFTDSRAFDELVRAAEGVPRDALNIASKAAVRAAMQRISVHDVRAAGRGWFQSDKEAALRSREEASRLLNWIIDKVIRERRARGFLVNQKQANNPLLLSLFDARVLHVVRRGYSAQDEPGERYDVYVIDYGAYVDLMQTRYAPQGMLPIGDDSDDEEPQFVDVPTQDLRAIRRAVLDIDIFLGSQYPR